MRDFLSDGKQKNTIAVLDGLRAIACLAIVTFHMNLLARFHGIWDPSLHGVGAFVSAAALFGESGVQLFFVLSGFLLFLPYGKAMLFDTGWPSLRRYYIRRIFRIWPGYFVALALMTLFVAPQYLQPEHLGELWLFLTFRMDFPATFQQLNAPFWTLAIEFQFYVVLPWLCWLIGLLVRRGPLPWRVCVLTCCLLLVMAGGMWSRMWGMGLVATPAFVPPTLAGILQPYIYARAGKYYEVFATGMLVCMCYLCYQKLPDSRWKNTITYVLSPLAFVAGLLLLGALTLWHFYLLYVGSTLNFLDPYQGFLTSYNYLLQPVLYGLSYGLCMFALLHGPSWLKRPFEWTPLRWLAMISYSLYMWHYLIIWHFINTDLPRFQQLGWSQLAQAGVYWLWLLLVAFPLSLLLYKVVEIPGIRCGEWLCRWLERGKASRAQGGNDKVSVPVPVSVPAEPTSVNV